MGEVNEIDQVIDALEELRRKKGSLLVGIDGCGGSGKSTLADTLKRRLGDTSVVEGDDFYLPTAERPMREVAVERPGSAYDWRRLKRQVLGPLAKGEAARYQPYEWRADRYGDWSEVPRSGFVLVEGVYVTRRELSEIYDFRIWVTCPRETRLKRGLLRDGVENRDLWENEWMAAEDRYVEMHRPQDSADFTLDGSDVM